MDRLREQDLLDPRIGLELSAMRLKVALERVEHGPGVDGVLGAIDVHRVVELAALGPVADDAADEVDAGHRARLVDCGGGVVGGAKILEDLGLALGELDHVGREVRELGDVDAVRGVARALGDLVQPGSASARSTVGLSWAPRRRHERPALIDADAQHDILAGDRLLVELDVRLNMQVLDRRNVVGQVLELVKVRGEEREGLDVGRDVPATSARPCNEKRTR